MEFHIPLNAHRIDLGAVERELQALDPAAIAGMDAMQATLRVSASLEEHQIAAALVRAGTTIPATSILRQPSTCCGGCGG